MLIILDQLPFLTQALDRGQIIGRDAFNFWMAGKLAFEGKTEQIYDNILFMDAVRQELGPGAGQHVFPYPPPALLLMAPFGWMPYLLTATTWSIIGAICFLLATISYRPNSKIILLALISPLFLYSIALGQNGLVTAALFIGGLRLAFSQPIISGVLIGCLAFKPMLAFLLPLALLLEKRWLVIISAGSTLITLCLLPIFIWGPNIWEDYIDKAIPYQKLLLEHGTGLAQPMKLTAFIAMRLLGSTIETAYIVQIIFSISALIILLLYGWRRRQKGNFDGRDITILAVATMIMPPYIHFYDMTLIAGGLLLLCYSKKITRNHPIARFNIIGLLWSLPILGLLFNLFGAPIAPIAMMISLYFLCQEEGKIIT